MTRQDVAIIVLGLALAGIGARVLSLPGLDDDTRVEVKVLRQQVETLQKKQDHVVSDVITQLQVMAADQASKSKEEQSKKKRPSPRKIRSYEELRSARR